MHSTHTSRQTVNSGHPNSGTSPVSAYRDTLTVTPVKGEISPVNFRAKPWRRLSTTPSERFFSKRCPPPAAALAG
jgi:hypothetical protein